jgi:hypothetical protein
VQIKCRSVHALYGKGADERANATHYFFVAVFPASFPASVAGPAAGAGPAHSAAAADGTGADASIAAAVTDDTAVAAAFVVVAVAAAPESADSAFVSSGQPASKAAQGASVRDRATTRNCERFMLGERAATAW